MAKAAHRSSTAWEPRYCCLRLSILLDLYNSCYCSRCWRLFYWEANSCFYQDGHLHTETQGRTQHCKSLTGKRSGIGILQAILLTSSLPSASSSVPDVCIKVRRNRHLFCAIKTRTKCAERSFPCDQSKLCNSSPWTFLHKANSPSSVLKKLPLQRLLEEWNKSLFRRTFSLCTWRFWQCLILLCIILCICTCILHTNWSRFSTHVRFFCFE